MATSAGGLVAILQGVVNRSKKAQRLKERQRFIAKYAPFRAGNVEDVLRRLKSYPLNLCFYNHACTLILARLTLAPFPYDGEEVEVYSLGDSALALLFQQGKIWKLSGVLEMRIGNRMVERCSGKKEYENIRRALGEEYSFVELLRQSFGQKFFEGFHNESAFGASSTDFLNMILETVEEVAASLFFVTVFGEKEAIRQMDDIFALYFVQGNFLIGWNTDTHKPIILALSPPTSS